MSRKGITPIVATILLLLLTVAVGGFVYIWFTRVQKQVQEAGEEKIGRLLEQISNCVRIESTHGNILYIRNCGVGGISNQTLTVYMEGKPVNFILEPSIIWEDDTGEIRILDYSLGKKKVKLVQGVYEETIDLDLGYALKFDGVDDYVALPISYGKNSIAETTVCAWVKSLSTAKQIIASFDRSEVWRLALKDDMTTFNVGWDTTDSSDATHDLGTALDYADGKWHFICGWYKAGASPDKKIFVDGVEVASATAHGGRNLGAGVERAATYGFIGVGSEASTFDGAKGPLYWFNGIIDEVRIYNRALSADEIKAHYQNHKLMGGIATWHLDEGKECIAEDSASDNDGFLKPNCPENSPKWVE